MIDLFVNKVILYDDNFNIIFNASEDNTQFGATSDNVSEPLAS